MTSESLFTKPEKRLYRPLPMPTPDVSDRDWGQRAFSPFARKVLAAIIEAFFSDEDPDRGLLPARTDLVERVLDEFDRYAGACSPTMRRGFNLLVLALELLPLFVIGTFSRASRLPLGRRVAYLQALEHERRGLLTMLFVGIKLPLTMIAYEVGPELRLTGFDRPSLAARRQLPILQRGGAS